MTSKTDPMQRGTNNPYRKETPMTDPMHPTRPAQQPTSAFSRALARRWPALAGAALATAVPLGVALADGFGASQFNAFQQPAIFADAVAAPAVKAQSEIVAVEASGVARNGSQAFGTGVLASGSVGVKASGIKTAVEARSDAGAALEASGATFGVRAHSTGGAGVDADSTKGPGVSARSAAGAGVEATGKSAGVAATAQDGSGVVASGKGQFGIGVVASGTFAGVQATADDTGVTDSGKEYGASFSGGKAPLRLSPATAQGAPKAGLHRRGELYVDSQGQLFLCTAEGTPGTWVKVAVTPAQ